METVVSFVKKHKVTLIILGAAVLAYILYDYYSAQAAANNSSASNDTDAADQAALQDELASLAGGDYGSLSGGDSSSPIATAPSISGSVPSSASNPVSTGTASPPDNTVDPTASVPISTTGPTPSGTPGTSNPISSVNSANAAGSIPGFVQQTESQLQVTNQQANQLYGSNTQNADEALYNEIEQGNPAAIAAMNSYNALFTEQDPQQAALNEAAGTNPYLAMLAQGVAGPLTPAELQANQAAGNPTIFQYPTSLTSNPSETQPGSETPAGPSGSSASGVYRGPGTLNSGVSSTITPPTSPGGLLPGISSGVNRSGLTITGGNPPSRPITTVPSSPPKAPPVLPGGSGTSIKPPSSPFNGGPVPARPPVAQSIVWGTIR